MFGGNDDDDDQDIWGSMFGKKKSNNPLSNIGGKDDSKFPSLMGVWFLFRYAICCNYIMSTFYRKERKFYVKGSQRINTWIPGAISL